MIERILNTIAPHRCSSCGEIGQILCESCKEVIISEPYAGCIICHAPCGQRGICSGCRRYLPVEQVWCVGDRRDGLKQLGDDYKFKNRRAGAAVLAELLDAAVPLLSDNTVIMPIPTLQATIRMRGFDHVGLVANELSRMRQVPATQLLERQSTATLHFLDRASRERLGPSLFLLKRAVSPDAHVVVLDDIVTTGTTLKSAVQLLKKAGAAHVSAAIIARQPFD